MAFYWECEAFRLAVAPWHSDPRRQRMVRARVAVAEQRTPGFALRFDLELLETEMRADGGDVLTPHTHLMRLVNQRQMLRAFEVAFVGLEAEKQRPPGGEERGNELLDQRLKKWLAGGGQVPAPPKEELARWLLAWMIVTSAAIGGGRCDKQPDEWLVLLCGEKGAECAVEDDDDDLGFNESGDANSPINDDDADNRERESYREDDSREEREDNDDDLPPSYDEVEATGSESPSPDLKSDEEIGQEETEQAAARLQEITRTRILNQSKETLANKLSTRGSSIRSSSSRSVASPMASLALVEQTEKSELIPTIVRLTPRFDSLDMVKFEESNKRPDNRRHFQQELRASRRDVQTAKQMREKVEKLAHLRHTQLLKESARKLRKNEEKRRDAQADRQIIADTLEYRDELNAMESRVKQATIAAHREQERVKRHTRVVLGNTEPYSRGAIKLGPGPLSKKEMEFLFSNIRDESTIYDLQGRRRSLEEAVLIAKENALESAMHKVRRLVLNSGKSVEMFRRYDLNRSGTLSYSEFQRMLRENGTGGCAELTEKQSMALFKHFDTNNSGGVDYGELLWFFFNWEAFLKRWYERKSANTTTPTDLEVRKAFKIYDPTNRGVVPLKEFQMVLDYLGVILGDNDANLLSVKFGAGKDGYIDYHKFLDFVNLSVFKDQFTAASAKQNSLSTCTAQIGLNARTAPPGMERIWMELQELSTSQARFHRLLWK